MRGGGDASRGDANGEDAEDRIADLRVLLRVPLLIRDRKVACLGAGGAIACPTSSKAGFQCVLIWADAACQHDSRCYGGQETFVHNFNLSGLNCCILYDGGDLHFVS